MPPELAFRADAHLSTRRALSEAILAAVRPQCSTLLRPRSLVRKVRRALYFFCITTAHWSSATRLDLTRPAAGAILVAQRPRHPAPNTETHVAPPKRNTPALNLSSSLGANTHI